MNADRSSTQAGFSLVELMVALTVGLLLLAGVLQILLANRRSFDAQSTTAHLQENVRLADFVLENNIAQAGYRPDIDIAARASDTALFPASDMAPATMAGSVVAGDYGGKNHSDTLRLRFRAAGGVRDCRGDLLGQVSSGGTPTPDNADLLFHLSADGDSLLCERLTTGSPGQPIIDHVDLFKVRYGLDTQAPAGVDRYTDTLSPAQQSQVRSVRIQLLVHSSEDDGDRALPVPVTQHYRFADGTELTITDRRSRVLLDRTVALRNLLP